MTQLRDMIMGLRPELAVYLLVLARMVGLMLIAPIFGSRLVPVRVRASVALFFSIALLPAVPAGATQTIASFQDPVWLMIAFAMETAIGFLIGLVAQFVFAGVQMAGQLAGISMGVGLANLVDPQTQERVTSLAQWQNLIALLLFLSVDGHHMLIRTVAQSLRLLPLGVQAVGGPGIGIVLTMAGGIFVIAMKIAAPVLVLILMINGALGVLTKMIPQLNVMVVGFGLNVAAGFFILGASQPFTFRILEGAFGGLAGVLAHLLRALG